MNLAIQNLDAVEVEGEEALQHFIPPFVLAGLLLVCGWTVDKIDPRLP